jgi:hypothetical protein
MLLDLSGMIGADDTPGKGFVGANRAQEHRAPLLKKLVLPPPDLTGRQQDVVVVEQECADPGIVTFAPQGCPVTPAARVEFLANGFGELDRAVCQCRNGVQPVRVGYGGS